MDIAKYILKSGPGSPGSLTKNVCETYLKILANNKNLTLKEFMIDNANLHFTPMEVSNIYSLFARDNTLPTFYTYCYFYVMTYNGDKLRDFHVHRKLISQVIVETVQKYLPQFVYTNYDRFTFVLIHTSVIITNLGLYPEYYAHAYDEFYGNDTTNWNQ